MSPAIVEGVAEIRRMEGIAGTIILLVSNDTTQREGERNEPGLVLLEEE